MAYPAATDSEWDNPGTGRHAFDEDAALTPIFHALTRGGWRSRQHEPAALRPNRSPGCDTASVDEFRRDPLTAPIPVQALVPPGTAPPEPALPGTAPPEPALPGTAPPEPALPGTARPEIATSRVAGVHAAREAWVDLYEQGRHHLRRHRPVGTG